MQRIVLITVGIVSAVALVLIWSQREPVAAPPGAAGIRAVASNPLATTNRDALESIVVTAPIALHRSEAHQSALDPSRDGWQSETVAAEVQAHLDRLGAAVTTGASLTTEKFAWVGDQFAGTPLRPKLEILDYNSPISVFGAAANSTQSPALPVAGRDGFGAALRDMVSDGETERFTSKVVAVELAEQSAATTHLVEVLLKKSDALVEQHAT